VERQSGSSQRDSQDPPRRGALAGSAREISPYQICHRRFQQWVRTGVLRQVLEALAEDLLIRGDLDLSECFVDGAFVAAKKGGLDVGKVKRGKGCKIMEVASLLNFLSLVVQIPLCFIDQEVISLVGEAPFTGESRGIPVG
jgi:hypothetical protein